MWTGRGLDGGAWTERGVDQEGHGQGGAWTGRGQGGVWMGRGVDGEGCGWGGVWTGRAWTGRGLSSTILSNLGHANVSVCQSWRGSPCN